MQEHFNENYVESHKYPKSEFKGVILNSKEINYSKDGTYNVKVKGTMSLHGVSKETEAEGQLVVKSGIIRVYSSFGIQLKSHNITIPSLVADKVATISKVKIECDLSPLK